MPQPNVCIGYVQHFQNWSYSVSDVQSVPHGICALFADDCRTKDWSLLALPKSALRPVPRPNVYIGYIKQYHVGLTVCPMLQVYRMVFVRCLRMPYKRREHPDKLQRASSQVTDAK